MCIDAGRQTVCTICNALSAVDYNSLLCCTDCTVHTRQINSIAADTDITAFLCNRTGSGQGNIPGLPIRRSGEHFPDDNISLRTVRCINRHTDISGSGIDSIQIHCIAD